MEKKNHRTIYNKKNTKGQTKQALVAENLKEQENSEEKARWKVKENAQEYQKNKKNIQNKGKNTENA